MHPTVSYHQLSWSWGAVGSCGWDKIHIGFGLSIEDQIPLCRTAFTAGDDIANWRWKMFSALISELDESPFLLGYPRLLQIVQSVRKWWGYRKYRANYRNMAFLDHCQKWFYWYTSVLPAARSVVHHLRNVLSCTRSFVRQWCWHLASGQVHCMLWRDVQPSTRSIVCRWCWHPTHHVGVEHLTRVVS